MLRRDGDKANHFALPVQIRYIPYKKGIRHYYFPEFAIESGTIIASFYRKQGHTIVKYTKQQLKDFWQIKNQSRAQEFERILEENAWTKADLARYLGVSRAWVTIVMREIK